MVHAVSCTFSVSDRKSEVRKNLFQTVIIKKGKLKIKKLKIQKKKAVE